VTISVAAMHLAAPGQKVRKRTVGHAAAHVQAALVAQAGPAHPTAVVRAQAQIAVRAAMLHRPTASPAMSGLTVARLPSVCEKSPRPAPAQPKE
jgi:hypothetical protein